MPHMFKLRQCKCSTRNSLKNRKYLCYLPKIALLVLSPEDSTDMWLMLSPEDSIDMWLMLSPEDSTAMWLMLSPEDSIAMSLVLSPEDSIAIWLMIDYNRASKVDLFLIYDNIYEVMQMFWLIEHWKVRILFIDFDK